MRIIKVLYLDYPSPYLHLPDLSQYGIVLEIIGQPCNPPHLEAFHPSGPRHEEITRLTANREVEIVVVGNNMGQGVLKAQAIAPAMRDRTIVVWNDYPARNEKIYAYHGFRCFGARMDLPRLINEMLGLSCE